MAVILNRTPIKYSTAGNPVVFALSATTSSVRLFQVDIIEQKTLSTVFTGKVYPTPNTPTQGYFNASNALDSIVKSDVENTDTLMLGKTLPIVGYKLNITDYGISGGTLLALSSGITTDFEYAYEAKLDIPFLTNNLTENTFVMTTGQTNGRFLTNQPNFKKVNEYSSEQLYLINDLDRVDMVVSTPSGNSTFTFTGSPENAITISGAVPEVRAIGYIAITGSTFPSGCNIRVRVLEPFAYPILGTYLVQASGQTNTQIATGLFNNIISTSVGTGYDFTLNNNLITITAPVGTGAAANSYTIVTELSGSTANLSYTIPGTQASVIISGYTITSANTGSSARVIVNDPLQGTISLTNFAITSFMVGNIELFTLSLVNAINTSPYGYSAFEITDDVFQIVAPYVAGTTSGCSIYNGVQPILRLNTGDFTGLTTPFTFTGGTDDVFVNNTITGATIIPNSVTGFTGGADVVPPVLQFQPEKMVRLQVSPKKLELSGVSLNIGDTYSIQIKSGTTALSEIKYYTLEDSDCNINYTNVFFTNSQGGVDNIQMLEPRINYNSERKSIIRNNINLESETPYKTGDRFNPESQVYETDLKAEVTLTTKPLNDLQTNWLIELVNSKEVYIEANTGDLIPVTLQNTDYLLQKRKLNRDRPIQIEFTFSLPTGFVDLYQTDNSIIINS